MTDQINITHREHPIPQVTDFAVQYASILELIAGSVPDDNCDRIVGESSAMEMAKLNGPISLENPLSDILDKLIVIQHLGEIGLETDILIESLRDQIAERISRER
jgi:hypothetical protein